MMDVALLFSLAYLFGYLTIDVPYFRQRRNIHKDNDIMTTTNKGIALTLNVPKFPAQNIRAGFAQTPGRYAICGVHFKRAGDDSVFATVTDGRILGIRKLRGECDVPVVVPGELVTRRKSDSLTRIGNELIENAKGDRADPASGNFPDIDKSIIPVADPKNVRVLNISGELLRNLATCIGSDDRSLTLLIPLAEESYAKPIPCLGYSSDGNVNLGVVMPRNQPKDIDAECATFNRLRAEYLADGKSEDGGT